VSLNDKVFLGIKRGASKKVYADNSRRHNLYKADPQMHTLGLHCNNCAIMQGMEDVNFIEDT
jgi:hypothetical protein